MRPVGQMAFTNYLMQSFICGLLFLGIGFGWYGHLQIYELYYVVLAVWILEICWSHIWLRYYSLWPFGMAMEKSDVLEETTASKRKRSSRIKQLR